MKANHNYLWVIIFFFNVWLLCKNKQFESQSQPLFGLSKWLIMCDFSVKINNLKANHNSCNHSTAVCFVWLLCKNKQFESQSQLTNFNNCVMILCDFSVKINNLKANHNLYKGGGACHHVWLLCKNKQFESQSQHTDTATIFAECVTSL